LQHVEDQRAGAVVYDVKPDEIPGKPGTIIRVCPLEGKVRTFVAARSSDLLPVDGSARR
jgi:hypothetical protein